MKAETIQGLNAINHKFYETTAAAFDATRQYPWPGWERLLAHIPEHRPLRVLDVGCGNGRFGLFLAEQVGAGVVYTGVDSSAVLLAAARAALAAVELAEMTLEERDVIASPPDTGAYDLVGLFGVLHHVPGWDQRRGFMRTLTERVAPGGIFAFAAWRFMDNPRLRQKTAPWPADLEREDGDYLLDWRRGTVALRYCHHVDDAEHETLIAATGLEAVTTYRADGPDNATNRYSILRRA